MKLHRSPCTWWPVAVLIVALVSACSEPSTPMLPTPTHHQPNAARTPDSHLPSPPSLAGSIAANVVFSPTPQTSQPFLLRRILSVARVYGCI